MHPYLILNGGSYNCFILPCFHQRAKRIGHKMAGFWKPFSRFDFCSGMKLIKSLSYVDALNLNINGASGTEHLVVAL